MSILSGFEKIKRYNKKSNGYKLLSHWTSSDTVELSSNGQTLTTAWANKADLVNGTVPIAQLPKVVFDEMVKVADDTARFALTTAQVQNGDTVYVIATSLMYLVIDDTKLNQEAGYQGYSAAVDWDTIDGRPDNITYWVDDDEEETGASISPVLRQNSLKTNLTTTVTGSPLDATMGKELQDEIDDIEGDISTINSNLAALPKIQRGVASGSTGLISVTFDTAFSSTPTVVVSAYGADATANNRVAVVRAVSNVGFQAKVTVANTGGDASTSISWIAVGA